MNHRITTASIGLALLSVGGAVTVASVASASSPTASTKTAHTIHFTDKAAGKAIDKGPLLIQADDDYDGKTLIGTDEINCAFSKTAGHCRVALSIKGGFLYGHFTEGQNDSLKGTITGGTGTFKGASGTISGTARKPITVTYRY